VDSAPVSADEREVRRVEAGTARYGFDLDEDRIVVEANLDDAISFDKGCYLGQEVVVRATSRGRVNRRLVGLVLEGDALRGAKLGNEAQPDAGVVTSVATSPRFGTIALAYVHRATLDADALVAVDGHRRACAVALPFTAESVARARARLAAHG
jgi:folate-binding protein YgfZ